MKHVNPMEGKDSTDPEKENSPPTNNYCHCRKQEFGDMIACDNAYKVLVLIILGSFIDKVTISGNNSYMYIIILLLTVIL